MASDFDNAMKDVFWQRLPDFAPVLHLSGAEPVEALRTNLPITLDADFVLGVGNPRRAVIDLSFQTNWDAETLIRVFVYNALLYRHYRVPIHSVILQLRSRQNDLRLASGIRYSAFPGLGGMDFQPEVINLWEQPLEPMLTGGLGLLPLAPLCRMPAGMTREQALPEILRRINDRLNGEAAPELNDALWNSTYKLSGIYLDRDNVRSLFDRYRIMKDSMTYQATLEDGRIEEAQRVLIRLGTKQNGPPDETSRSMITAIEDRDRLERMCDAILTAKSWLELLSTP
jgi:hypothetical protein